MAQKHLLVESVTIPADHYKQMQKGMFKEWVSVGRFTVDDSEQDQVRVKIVATSPDENSSQQEDLLGLLEEYQTNGSIQKIPIKMNVLLPKDLTGYVIGTKGATIMGIQDNCSVEAKVVKNILIREQFHLMEVSGNSVDRIQNFLGELKHLLDMAQAKNTGKPRVIQSTGGKRETRKIPTNAQFPNPQFEQQLKEIERDSNVTIELEPPEQPQMLHITYNDSKGKYSVLEKVKEAIKQLQEQQANSKPIDEKEVPPVVIEKQKASPPKPSVDATNSAAAPKRPIKLMEKPLKKKANMPAQNKKEMFEVKRQLPDHMCRHLIGKQHQNRLKLQRQLNVELKFPGGAHKDFRKGRHLLIRGETKELVDKASEEILKICKELLGKDAASQSLAGSIRVPVPSEMIERDVDGWQEKLKEIKERTGLQEFCVRNEHNGTCLIILKGTKECMKQMEKKLLELADAFKAENDENANADESDLGLLDVLVLPKLPRDDDEMSTFSILVKPPHPPGKNSAPRGHTAENSSNPNQSKQHQKQELLAEIKKLNEKLLHKKRQLQTILEDH